MADIKKIMGVPPRVGEVEVHTAKTWQFRFDPYGWAHFTINEGTGDFHISSDWGSYAARWPAQVGKLESFLAFSVNSQYITRNLSHNREFSFREQIDPDATEKEIKNHILEARRGLYIEADEARDLYEDAERFVGEAECGNCLYSAMSDALYTFLEEPWCFLVYNPSPRYLILQEWLIPVFQEHLRNELSSKKDSTAGDKQDRQEAG